MYHLEEYKLFEAKRIQNIMYHGTSNKLSENIERTKILLMSRGLIGTGFYLTYDEKTADHWGEMFYRSKKTTMKFELNNIPLRKIYTLGTIYPDGGFGGFGIYGERYRRCIEEVEGMYPGLDYRDGLTKMLLESGYDAIYCNSRYSVSGLEQLCVIRDGVIQGYKLKQTELDNNMISGDDRENNTISIFH
jgi:hypothetical protein